MKKDLETADTIVKLVLACTTIILYLTNAIAGRFAVSLVVLSVLVLVIFVARWMLKRSVKRR